MSYKLLARTAGVIRMLDGAVLPVRYANGAAVLLDESSTDGKAFVAWLAAGNTPMPDDTPIPTKDDLAAAASDAIDRLEFDVLFNTENRIRTLEGKAAITRVQYRDALIARWKVLNP